TSSPVDAAFAGTTDALLSQQRSERASGSGCRLPCAPMADPHLARVVVGEDELHARIRELGKEITADYADAPPLLIGVLKGAFMFMADLARSIELPVDFDFMAVSSYGSATRSSGVVRIVKDLDAD